jgi:hypothetical protein
MTIRDDIKLLRRFAQNDGGHGIRACEEREALCAVRRLYKDDSLRGVRLAKVDIFALCVTLNAIPMTVEQRERVDSGLRKIGEAAEHNDGCERHAEIAIESITEEIGIHDYHDAAKAVLATWSAMVKIREAHVAGSKQDHQLVSTAAIAVVTQAIQDHNTIKTLHGIFHTTTLDRLVAVAQGAFSSSTDGAWLLGIKREWDAWSTNDPKAEAQQRVIDILRALRESMDDPLTDALDESIEVLEYMLGTIPF